MYLKTKIEKIYCLYCKAELDEKINDYFIDHNKQAKHIKCATEFMDKQQSAFDYKAQVQMALNK